MLQSMKKPVEIYCTRPAAAQRSFPTARRGAADDQFYLMFAGDDLAAGRLMMAGASSASSTAVQYSESVAARQAGGGGLAGHQHARPGPPHQQGRGPLPPPQRSKIWPGKSTALFFRLRAIAAMLHPGKLGVEQQFKY